MNMLKLIIGSAMVVLLVTAAFALTQHGVTNHATGETVQVGK